MKLYSLCLCVSVVFLSSNLFAQTLDVLDQKIRVSSSRIIDLTKEYEREKKLNEARIRKAEALRPGNQGEADKLLKQAYASAENLNRINSTLNELKQRNGELCQEWRSLYAKTIDDLLAAADQETNKKKKGEIGKALQRYQSRNLQLCVEGIRSTVPQEWRSLRIENYDGPNEIQQKIQLLQDISREININLAKLDQQYQNALREQKTKERAQEFIQESTLFTDTVIVHSGTTTASGPGSEIPTAGEFLGNATSPGDVNSPQAIAASDPFNKEYGDEFKAQYQKTKNELIAQQKELKKKITEFDETARTLQIP